MEGAVYLLCAATALVCAVLLFRGYSRSRAPLLWWCALCFLTLAVDNGFVFIDLVLFPTIDLSLTSTASALIGTSLLLYSLIWETR